MPKKIIRLREPLFVGYWGVYSQMIFPSHIMMGYWMSFSEGFDHYRVRFEFDGNAEYDDVTEEYEGVISPVWLENISADLLKEYFRRLPLNKDSGGAANGLTRKELADIIKDVPEHAYPSGRLVSEY